VNCNHECWIWQLGEDTSRRFASALAQIGRQSHVASMSFFYCLSNFTYTFLQKLLNPLPANPFSIIKIIQQQPALKCLQKICNAISQCRGLSPTWFKRFCLWITDRCLFPTIPATDTFFHRFNAPQLAWTIILAYCFKEISVWFRLISSLCSAPPKSDKSSLSSSASY